MNREKEGCGISWCPPMSGAALMRLMKPVGAGLLAGWLIGWLAGCWADTGALLELMGLFVKERCRTCDQITGKQLISGWLK